MKTRTTLPKDFEALLEAGDLATLRAVFDKCDVDARGGIAKQTALAFDLCPDELARWLVEHGADLSAADTWGNTPLHTRARSWRGRIAVLLELGANIHAMTQVGTPLHAAADGVRTASVELLLAAGAHVDAKNQAGSTPLEHALDMATNGTLVEALAVARMLLGAGATRTPRMKPAVTELGKRYEFHRGNIASEIAEATSNALDELYLLFDIPPVPRRERHDGTSKISPKATTWQKQHAELWNLLVPSSGPAETVQGEVIRIAGKLAREIVDNGAVNWNPAFVALSRAFGELLRRGTTLAGADARDAEQLVAALVAHADCDVDRLAQLAIAWVLINPEPLALGAVDYKI